MTRRRIVAVPHAPIRIFREDAVNLHRSLCIATDNFVNGAGRDSTQGLSDRLSFDAGLSQCFQELPGGPGR